MSLGNHVFSLWIFYLVEMEVVHLVPANGSYCEDYECHSFFPGTNWNYGKLIIFPL